MNNEISSKTFSSVTVSLAVIIPDTPIVSIAGSTLLSDITTTITSTTTTPTPVATSKSIEKSKLPQTAQSKAQADNAKATTTKHSMSDAAAKTAGAAAHATGAVAVANSNTTVNTNINNLNVAAAINVKKETTSADTELTTATTQSGKPYEATKPKQPEFLLYDLDDGRLKKLLDEAYSYKNPRDKENKSDIFLTLLSQVENEKEDQPYNYRASRYTRNSSSISTTSASYSQHHYPHSHHHHKQGGSLQDLSFDAVRNESLLDCDYNFSVGGQRNRRHNRNSRQTKYSSVSSRQREGGSLPSNVNVTNCGSSGIGIGQLGSALEQPLFLHDLREGGAVSKQQQQQQRRNTVAAAAGTAVTITADKVKEALSDSGEIIASLSNTDYVIEMDEPMMDIEQQEHILPCKGHDVNTQKVSYYDRLQNYDVRIPRISLSGSAQPNIDFAPTRAQTYIDEGVRFTTLERSSASGTGSGGMAADTGSGEIIDSSDMFAVPSTVAALLGGATGKTSSSIASCSASIDAKYLPLDENYKSCKSVLGEKSEMVKTPAAASSMFSTTKTITRQFDENGNSLNEMYQTSGQAAAAVINASATVAGAGVAGVNNTTSTGSSVNAANTGQSQAKAKLKKKSQQERNTKTVDVESVAGYRGKDPVDLLVKYIESTGEDNNNSGKQGDSKSQSNKFNESNNKKKARKQEKEKQHKMKKSNSLEELRSCAKIDVDDLKRTAATTESNVMMRNKSAGKNNKNNSSSTADINKNFDSKEMVTSTSTTTPTTTTTASGNKATTAIATNVVTTNSRKGERRSWGTEELQYLGEHHQHNNNNNITNNSNNNHEEKSKDKEEKCKDKEEKCKDKEEKSNEKDKEKEKDKKSNHKNKENKDTQKEQDNKEQKEKDKEREKEKEKEKDKHNDSTVKLGKGDQLFNAADNVTSPVSSTKAGGEKLQQPQQQEKPEKQDKQDKRKKSESSLLPSVNTILSVGTDVPAMDATLTPETEEFHVVTKKKKAKKHQRTSVDDQNSGACGNAFGLNRAHNFMTNMQKPVLTGTVSSAALPQQQQQVRYKYYNNNNNSGNNGNNSTYTYNERVEYFGAYHGNNYNNNSSNYNNYQYQYQYQQHNQQSHSQQQQQQHVGSGGGSVVADKSRRKSTSSMPPSEKSDSSDLDSVHSLPIESTTKSSSGSSNSNSNDKTRYKGNSAAANSGNNKNALAPISYAGIAAAAAATQTVSNTSVAEKWPVVDVANSSNHVTAEAANNVEELMIVATAANGTAATAAVIAQSGGANTKLKAKKLAHKSDFPELVASTAPVAAAASTPLEVLSATKVHAYKPVSYSQRVAAVGAATATSGGGNGGNSSDVWVNSAAAPSVSAASTVMPAHGNEFKEMDLVKTELLANNTLTNVANSSLRPQTIQQPQQAPPQQPQIPLQKSKSVEHESYNYNSCNLDQQYPALEKTVKRHSAVNVAGHAMAISPPAATATSATAAAQFNFAAAAKHQTHANNEVAPAMQPTTTTTSSNNIVAAATATPSNINATVKKSKEKSPPDTCDVSNNIHIQSVATVAAARKHKKDKHQMLDAIETTTTAAAAAKNSMSTQTNATLLAAGGKHRGVPVMSNNGAAPVNMASSKGVLGLANNNNNNKMYKTQVGHSKGSGSGMSTTTMTTTTTTNRPAVIILNDDRSLGASNEFTFGDFNEDELKFFDDDIAEEDGVVNDVQQEQQQYPAVNKQLQTAQRSPITTTTTTTTTTTSSSSATSTCFNDSGASDVVNNTTQQSDDMLLSGSDACSPNASFAHSQSVSGGTGGNATGYQSNDSGIYTTSTTGNKINKANKSSSNVNHKRMSPTLKEVAAAAPNKWNNFLKIPFFNVVSEPTPATAAASLGSSSISSNSNGTGSTDNSGCLPQQQLETCNQIETAIISAARAAAEYELHKQQPHHQQQQLPQQQQQQNSSNSFSNSSSFSSSSSVSMDAAPGSMYPTALESPSSNHSYRPTRRSAHHTDSSNNKSAYAARSRSSSSQHGAGGVMPAPTAADVVVSIQRKEFDIHFIPPPVSTAFNLLQHNGIIVDFINSAWEEVAKVTKFYDGQ